VSLVNQTFWHAPILHCIGSAYRVVRLSGTAHRPDRNDRQRRLAMDIAFEGKLTNWEEIKKMVLEVVGLPDTIGVQDLEKAIRRAGVERVNKALVDAGHTAKVKL